MRRRHGWWGAVALASVMMMLAGTAAASPPFVESDAEAIYTVSGASPGDYFGWVGANIGDLDGDGVTEIAVSAIYESSGGTEAGRVYVYSGATGSQLAVHDGTDYEFFGYSVAAAGDVNADGVPDYIVGAPGDRNAPQPPLGRAVVYSGADHSVIYELEPVARNFFGGAVSGAGDLNADGYDDFVIGAIGDNAQRGRLTAYSGADATVLWSASGNHAAGGNHSGDLFGSAAGAVGDVNGDGVPDVAVGAYGDNGGRGNAYVLSGVDGSVIHVLKPLGDADVFGVFFASGAGDIDGDGVNDVFVGDYSAGRGPRSGTGAAYVFSGATGKRLLVLSAEETGDGFGPGRGIGDVNGDGHGDLIVAAYTSSAGAPTGGKAYVISGADGTTLRTITSTIPNDYFGVDALGLGDVNADGLTDFMVTAFAGSGPGTAYVIKGTDLTP
jgi:hypothetical protein